MMAGACYEETEFVSHRKDVREKLSVQQEAQRGTQLVKWLDQEK